MPEKRLFGRGTENTDIGGHRQNNGLGLILVPGLKPHLARRNKGAHKVFSNNSGLSHNPPDARIQQL